MKLQNALARRVSVASASLTTLPAWTAAKLNLELHSLEPHTSAGQLACNAEGHAQVSSVLQRQLKHAAQHTPAWDACHVQSGACLVSIMSSVGTPCPFSSTPLPMTFL